MVSHFQHEDCKLLFRAQDKFVVANANATNVMTQDIFCDASSSGVTYYNDAGTVTHDYALMTHFEAMVAKLSAAPN